MDSDDSKHLYSKIDRSSLANPSEALSTNIKLEWDINFEKQTITGSVEHTVKIVTDGATHVDFDSAKINIIGDVLVNNEKGTYTAAPVHEILGTKLSVDIPTELRAEGTHFTVQFNYSINTDASAMQWLPASATKGLKYPYLFTQSQAIHARSLLPCQDSPGIKTQYTARVTAPKWCTVLMSALADTTESAEAPRADETDKSVFVWKQPVPTPAYLIALAAGNLESREISHRVRVWAEPEVVDSALFEFSETEDFVLAAEELTGCPYQWTRYDILCLPPSFPYGGMENPCLTFATPTLLAGDKSLADVIAHEIAHSWTGNLVTNHTWDHFWLNEGWTVWLERKITSKVRNNEELGRLSTQVGWKHLQDDVKLLGASNPFTALTWKLDFGEDPDSAYSGVPYEKGCNLLTFLEEVVGAELFSQFVHSYIETFKFNTVTTGAFRDHFVSFFDGLATAETAANAEITTPTKKKNGKKNKHKAAKEDATTPSTVAANAVQAIKGLDWNNLFYTPGIPSDVTSFSNSLSKSAEELAHKWITLAATCKTASPPEGCTSSDMESWPTLQKSVFLETLQNFTKKSLSHPSDVFTVPFLELMDRTYSLSASKNAEIMLRWQTLCLESEAEWIVAPVVDFITSQGRMKFARPLYRLLRASAIGKQIAIDTFEAKKDIYHPIARKMIAADLRRADEAEAKEAVDDQFEAEQEVAAVHTPAEAAPVHKTPETTAKVPQDNTPAPIASPDRSQTPDFSTPAATPSATPAKASDATPAKVETPAATPAKVETPAATPAKVETPAATPAKVKSPVATPAKVETPVATPAKVETPVATPAKVETPAATPAKVETPVATPAKVETPVATPAKVETPVATPAKVDTPAATPAKVETPVATPAKVETSVATPAKVETPVATPAKVETPVATPAKVETSVATPAKVETPVATPAKMETPAATPAKVETPAATPAKVETPVATPAKAETPVTSKEVPVAAKVDVSTFKWSGISIFVALSLGAVGAFWFSRRYRR